jgi:putative tricarboxylic transport membrane protein
MRSRVELSLAFGIVSLGVLMLAGVFRIGAGAGYDRIGPRFFPSVVATGLVVLGGWYAVSMWRNSRRGFDLPPEGTKTLPLNWRALGYLTLSFILCVAVLERVGFVVASSIQVWLVTRAFESRSPVRDAVVAVVVVTAVYLAFSRGLGLALP